MPLQDKIPLIKFIFSLAIPVLYIIAFAKESWIEADDFQWGLWNWCFTNITNDSEDDNDTQKCHSISPGDSPGYYEGVRTISCFTLVAFVLYYGTFDENKDLGREHKPIFVALSAAIGAVITLGVLSAHYEEDERWMHQNPKLGWCFWMVVSTTILSFLMCFVFWKNYRMKQPKTSSTAPQARTAVSTARPASTTTSESSSDGGQRRGSPSPNTGRGGDSGPQVPVSPPPYAEYPLLNMPQEASSRLPPVVLPFTPPPSYEEATRGGYSSVSSNPPPPPVYVSSVEGFNRSNEGSK